jgi:hypothetical protein
MDWSCCSSGEHLFCKCAALSSNPTPTSTHKKSKTKQIKKIYRCEVTVQRRRCVSDVTRLDQVCSQQVHPFLDCSSCGRLKGCFRRWLGQRWEPAARSALCPAGLGWAGLGWGLPWAAVATCCHCV